MNQREFIEGEKYIHEGWKLFNHLQHETGEAWSLYSYGILKLNMGHFKKALDYSNKAMEKFDRQNNKIGVAFTLHILGLIALKNKDFSCADRCYREKLLILQQEKNWLSRHLGVNCMGSYKSRYGGLGCGQENYTRIHKL
jgi:tetratricopeptide (TPR) repeat protein